jgi:DNA repair exonuclease SbcCD ATPase subunit
LRVERLHLKNFLSHKDSEVSLANLGVVLIEGQNRDRGGSNGAGKTALIEGLFWCLYGQLLRPIKLSKLSHHDEGNVYVQTQLRMDDGAKVVVTRTHGAKGQQPLTLEINDVNVSAGTATETQKQLTGLLRMDAKTFQQVVLFSGGQDVFAALTDKGQKEILDAILGLDRLPRAQERVAEELKQFKFKRQALDQQVQNLKDRVSGQESSIAKLTESHEGFKKTNQVAVTKAKAEVVKLSASEPVVPPELVKQVEDGDKRLAALQAKLGPLQANAKTDLSALVKAKQTKVRLETELVYAKRAIVETAQIINPDEMVAEHSSCPTCKQSLPASALKALHKTYVAQQKEQEAKQTDADAKLWEISQALIAINKDMLQLQEKHELSSKDLEEYNALKHQVAEKRGELKLLTAKHQSWQAELDRCKAELAKLKKSESPFLPLIEHAKRELDVLQGSFAQIKAQQDALDEQQAYLEFWHHGFGNKGVKGLILDSITPYLNECANHYLGILSSGTAKVEFLTHTKGADGEIKERFGVESSQDFGAASYEGASAGERRRVDLACLFALGDLAQARAGTRVELRLLDEPFERVDEVGHNEVVRLLRTVASEVGTLLLTSHEEAVKALIDQRILVSKHRGVSSVVQ